MSSVATWAVLARNLTSGPYCHHVPPDYSWTSVKELACVWHPRTYSPIARPKPDRVAKVHDTLKKSSSILPLNAPHKPSPDYGSPEWEKQEADNRARERPSTARSSTASAAAVKTTPGAGKPR